MFPTLYKAFVEKDMSLLEVNPLIVTKDGHLRRARRQGQLRQQRALPPPRARASCATSPKRTRRRSRRRKFDLAYVALDGNIGCMVNGAGLAMATMDIIKLYGEEPANFLDVGGGAARRRSPRPSRSSPPTRSVKGILVNIFGGIMRCDVIAEGVIAAVKEVGLKVPLVVRLEGTNVKEGKAILNASGLDVISRRRPRRRGAEDRRRHPGPQMTAVIVRSRTRKNLSYAEIPVASFEERGFRRPEIAIGDQVFWFTSETRGGHGLYAMGTVREIETRDGGLVAIEAGFHRFAPNHRLGVNDFAALERLGEGSPLQELNGILYMHSHNKVATVGDDVRRFIEGHFH